MADYTPTTEQIKDLCLLGAIDAADGEHNLDMVETVAMINRWLAEHDAAIRTAALEEAAAWIANTRIGGSYPEYEDEYTMAEAFRAEKEEKK